MRRTQFAPVSSTAPTTSQGTALHDAKVRTRALALARRDGLDAADRTAADAAIVARLVALPSFAAARRVLLTLPFGSECDTLPLVTTALAAGKRVVLPRVDVPARVLRLHEVRDPAKETAPGYRGIREPQASLPEIAPSLVDWVLVPGVAFDRRGCRLGYGGGFYDRLLPLVPGGAPRVAAAYATQLLESVPAAPHDAVVDILVTEVEVVFTSRHE